MSSTRKMISNWNASYIQALVELIETQSKLTLVFWAINYAEEQILPLWTKHYPKDLRPINSINAARSWLSGKVKLPQAKSTILECHAAAREAGNNPVAQASARAIGQSASTIHSARHCIGLPLYGALAIAYDRLGTKAPWSEIEQHAAEACKHMLEALQDVSIENEPNPAKINWNC